jgi:hypothetical protein
MVHFHTAGECENVIHGQLMAVHNISGRLVSQDEINANWWAQMNDLANSMFRVLEAAASLEEIRANKRAAEQG